jgi:type II secretory pathway component PulF
MPLYDYTGQLPSGVAFQGTLEAGSTADAEDQLGRMGVRVTTLRPARRLAYVAPLSLTEFTFFNEQLTALTKASLPLDEGLRQLAADVGSRKLKRLLLDLAADLQAGTPLEQGIARQQHRFPPQFPEVVAAGLKTGDLGGTLYGLTAHLRLKSTARRTLLELTAYPLLVLVLGFIITTFIMRRVAPALLDMTGDMTGFMTRPALGPEALLRWLVDAWPVVQWLAAGVLGLLILLAIVVGLPGVRGWREAILRRVPGFAQVYWSSVLARFAHTSALAAYSGTPLPDLVAASGAASGSPRLNQATQRVAERLNTGATLLEAAGAERAMPALWVTATTVAGPRGDLPAVLAELARGYELRAEQWVSTVQAILGPLLFLILALGIGGIVVLIMQFISTFFRILTSITMI